MSSPPPASALLAPEPSSASKIKAPKPPKVKGPQKPPQPQTRSSKLRGNPNEPLEARISKTVTYFLRHAADKAGLNVDGEGWVKVEELLDHPALIPYLNLESLKEMVEKDKKGRLALALRPSPSPSQPSSSSSSATEASTSTPIEKGEWYIRANQGHSIELEGIEDGMRRVESVEEAGEAVHGTTGLGVWKEIYATGLSKMTRQHIHLALSTPPAQTSTKPEDKVTSGIRATSHYLLYLDVPLLLEHNVPLFLSTNDVLLSPGDPNASSPGRIERAFFLRLVERKTGRVVWKRGDEGDGVEDKELEVNLGELKID
ncbi:KptA family-domain-containing protein [Mrakia frigida]|uniref:tRNA 2'-phosphotransferase n=1 Tax=Mrakia frigida TaxID=29902 RepID=UPI003FCBF6A1